MLEVYSAGRMPSIQKALGLTPSTTQNQAWRCMALMPAPRRWRQEDRKFRILLSYREDLRQAELQEILSKRIKRKKKQADSF